MTTQELVDRLYGLIAEAKKEYNITKDDKSRKKVETLECSVATLQVALQTMQAQKAQIEELNGKVMAAINASKS